jgi:hypothetical protein
MEHVVLSQQSSDPRLDNRGVGSKLWGPPNAEEAAAFLAYCEGFGRSKSLQHFDRVAGAVESCIDTNAVVSPVIDTIIERIRTRTPASFVRMGDGEGNVLFHKWGRYRTLSDYCLRKISRICFGAPDTIHANFSLFSDVLLQAIEHADFIGGPPRSSIDTGFDKPLDEIDVRGVCGMRGLYNYLATDFPGAKLKGKMWGGTFYSRGLMPYYASFLHRLPFIGVVTCYDALAPALAQHFHIKDHASVLIPMQASIARKMETPNGHLERYTTILDEIRPPFQGAVYIVAAGHLGKSYCSMIKRRGGIAIDVGSIADVWMGITSRPGITPDFVERWKIADYEH